MIIILVILLLLLHITTYQSANETIQAILPFWIYLSKLVIIFQTCLQSYFPPAVQNIIIPFNTVPMYAPAAINPVVAIFLLRPYRKAVIRLGKYLTTNWLKFWLTIFIFFVHIINFSVLPRAKKREPRPVPIIGAKSRDRKA